WGDPVPLGPQPRELVDLRLRADDARKLVVDDVGQRGQRIVVSRLGEHEVERRRPQRGGDRLAGVAGDPESRAWVAAWVLAQQAGNSETQVVPGLVGQQQRPRLIQKGVAVHSSSSTSGAPPATWSPSDTYKRATMPS